MKENQITEWKESWRDEYLRWLCGFANAEGGVLVIGRNDKDMMVTFRANPAQIQSVDKSFPSNRSRPWALNWCLLCCFKSLHFPTSIFLPTDFR